MKHLHIKLVHFLNYSPKVRFSLLFWVMGLSQQTLREVPIGASHQKPLA